MKGRALEQILAARRRHAARLAATTCYSVAIRSSQSGAIKQAVTQGMLMKKLAAIFVLALATVPLAGCYVEPAPGPVAYIGPPHAVWIPGHYGPYGGWIPGHWRG